MRPQYEKLDQIEHIHKRSDMYVGSLKPKKEEPPFLEPLYLSLLKQDTINNETLSCQFKK